MDLMLERSGIYWNILYYQQTNSFLILEGKSNTLLEQVNFMARIDRKGSARIVTR